MKKIINAVESVEEQMIQGLVKSAPKKLRKLDCGTIVVRAAKKAANKVALVSGGGSGHEPAHGGFVGEGMLDAAVAGAVFTSPTPDQILEGIKAVATDQGVLCVVKNYTGDVMNFEMAIEMAADEGIKADHVVVNDDVAVKDSLYTTGRRGVAARADRRTLRRDARQHEGRQDRRAPAHAQPADGLHRPVQGAELRRRRRAGRRSRPASQRPRSQAWRWARATTSERGGAWMWPRGA